MSESLPLGLKHSLTVTVDESLIVPGISRHFDFADMPKVFATASMVALVEAACVAALKPYLKPGQRSVGIDVDLSHSAATPIGMKVTAEVELVEIHERKLLFKVTCRDEVDVIGEGFHERAFIDFERFNAKVAAKAKR
jgi:fluoroacetyl-CoA thioesterase